MVAREEGHAAEVDANIALTNTSTHRTHWNSRHSLNTDIQFFQIVYLAHSTVNHDTFPLVLGS
ncbi:hypothetical protein D3C73_1622930 [compost metagenome]